MKKYKIKNFGSDEVTPEETFFDSIQNHSSLEQPINSRFFIAISIIVALFFAVFIIKAFQLQLINGEAYASKLSKDSSQTSSSFLLRGVIYDNRNRPLVENTPSLQLLVVPNEVRFASESQKWLLLSDNLILSKTELIERLEKGKNEGAFILKKNIDKDSALVIKNLDIKGVYVTIDAQRNYIYDESLAHVIGYTGRVNKKDIDEDDFYFINDRIGRSGIEAFYEKYLRGQHSQLIFDTDNDSREKSLSTQDIATGNHLVLTLDLDVQIKLHQIMANIFRSNNIKRGAAVVQKVHTGEIVAMTSLPSYDPNAFQGLSKDADYVTALFNNEDRPLFNRIISGKYVPGSTIKPLYALAILIEGIVDQSKLIYSGGSITIPSIYDPNIKYTFRDWKKHGWTDIRKAIADSVDIYFYATCGGLSGPGYETIKGMGIEKMIYYLNMFMVDKKLGIDLPGEAVGFIPTPKWKQETKKEPWLIGDTYNASIGQGDLLITPLWLNTYISALANDGLIMKPFLVRQIIDSDDRQVEAFHSKILAELTIAGKELNIVRSGMRQTITDGTATRLKGLPVEVAGKTGTAQVSSGNKLNSLFSAYAPFDNPEIAITVIVEDIPADTQSLAVEISKQFLNWYFVDFKQH